MNALQKSAAIKNGLRKRSRDGSSKMARRKRYRYTIHYDGGLEINPDELKVVSWIFERYLAGDSLEKFLPGWSGRAFSSFTGRPKWNWEAIDELLSNELYLGNTINLKSGTEFCKDKRHVEHPPKKRPVFEGTRSALVTQEVWDIVQRVRQNRRRSTKMNEQNKYSGLVVCAACGTTMVLHRAHTMKPT